MITYTQDEEKGIAELRVEGGLTRDSFDEIVSQLGPLMETHGSVGLLKHIVSLGAISPSVLWDDVKFGLGNFKHIGAVAVVSDKKWIEVWTKLASPFWRSEVHFFAMDDLDEARAWLIEQVRMDRSTNAPGASSSAETPWCAGCSNTSIGPRRHD